METLIVFQNILIGNALAFLVLIPTTSLFIDMGFVLKGVLYTISFGAVFLVMLVRPLADIFTEQLWLRRLVILRKGLGILSASIIVGFMLSAIIAPESIYSQSLFTVDFYSFDNYRFFAHIGDISGFILLITSNIFSQKLLKRNWKRIQRLSYVYFYAGGIYEAFALKSMFAFYALLIVTALTTLAWAAKILRRNLVLGS
ncbi:MAG: hypothetical protein Q7S04_02745 [Candidatus Moranbacteria bacterium]|nr:hypothetical protein [Candidatus Moranbacteria bacterium]